MFRKNMKIAHLSAKLVVSQREGNGEMHTDLIHNMLLNP
jgi:hypothetical protein